MKSSQTVSNKGGNCKMKNFFCHLCSCTKHQLVSYTVGNNRCDRCQRRNRDKCYHHSVCDSISTEKLLAELEEQLFGYIEKCSKSYEEISKLSKLLTDPLQVNKEHDLHHIDFIIPENDPVKKREFTQFIGRECLIRKITTNGSSVENWHEALRESVFIERRIRKLRWSRSADGAHQIEPIQEHNTTVRCMMNSISLLIESEFSNGNNEDKTKLILACSKYSQAIELLTAHRILTDEELDMFQELIDDFFQIWIELFSTEGMPNYIHLLGAGHILYFLQKYKCLYIYSQQGWESMNSICTGYILQNSSRGGKGSGENGSKSYIYPLIRYLVRDLLWKTGEANRFFIEQECKKLRAK